MTARGIRNNNPTNLVHIDVNKWQGLAVPPNDGRFCRFEAPAWGIRAAALNLISYQDRYGLRTIRELIGRWAPWSENDVYAYVSSVSKRMARGADEMLDLHAYADLRPLIVAIIWHECGAQPYGDEVIDEGLRRAGVIAPPPPVRREAGMTPASVATASTVGAGAVEALAEATSAVQGLSPYLDVAKYLLLALALAGLGVTLWRLWQKHRAVVS